MVRSCSYYSRTYYEQLDDQLLELDHIPIRHYLLFDLEREDKEYGPTVGQCGGTFYTGLGTV
jgi:hypothetical protein